MTGDRGAGQVCILYSSLLDTLLYDVIITLCYSPAIVHDFIGYKNRYGYLLKWIFGKSIKKHTSFCESFCESEEGHGHEEVGNPVGGSRERVAGGACPQWVDLRVNGPRHGAHTWGMKG